MNVRQEMLNRLRKLVNLDAVSVNNELLLQADLLMRHHFNALGSGWIHNCYGMQAPGFQGLNYSDPSLTPEKIRATVPEWYLPRQSVLVRLISYYHPDYVPIDWQIDIKSGARYQIDHISRIGFGKIEGMDAKMPSELSRMYHLVVLGRAWRATRKEEFRREIVAQVLDWLSVHPAEYGAGWRAPMNAAIRIVNLLTALALISPSLDPCEEHDGQFLDIVYETLKDHRKYIAENLEYTENATCLHPNHYIADLAGLLVLSSFLRDYDPEALAWENLARREFGLTMRWQINPDGIDFEATTMYHAFALEMLVDALILSARLHDALTAEAQRDWLNKTYGEDFSRLVYKMFAALRDLIQPNRHIPVVGDNDSGRFLCLENPGGHDTDRVFFCGIGAALFHDSKLLPPTFTKEDWAYAATMMNGLPCALPEKPNPVKSAAFRDSGFYVLRNRDAYAFVCCAPIGTAGKGAHSHNDRLEVLLSLRGEDIVIDPGVYAYTASKKYRNMYRNVEAHSTVSINGLQPNRLNPEDCWWGYRDDTRCECLEFRDDGASTVFRGQHHAYERLDIPVTHSRTVELKPTELIIHDQFLKDPRFGNEMPIDYTFMLGSSCKVVSHPDHLTLVSGKVELSVKTQKGEWALENGYYAPCYGAHADTLLLRIHFDRFIEENEIRFVWESL